MLAARTHWSWGRSICFRAEFLLTSKSVCSQRPCLKTEVLKGRNALKAEMLKTQKCSKRRILPMSRNSRSQTETSACSTITFKLAASTVHFSRKIRSTLPHTNIPYYAGQPPSTHPNARPKHNNILVKLSCLLSLFLRYRRRAPRNYLFVFHKDLFCLTTIP